MKILQINTVGKEGSTGRTTFELHDELIKNGIESYVAYGQGELFIENFHKIGGKLENHIHNIQSRIFGKQGYYTRQGTKELLDYIDVIKPDIIHLRNLHGNYLNIELLFNFLQKKNIPIIWNLHDCWAYTGKCTHYTDVKCFKWKIECNNCPQKMNYPSSIFFDKTNLMYKDKKKWFTSISRMRIITVSKWLENEVKQSFLNKFFIQTIYNWVDLKTFKPLAAARYDAVKSKYGISKNNFVILGVSAGWYNDSKLNEFIKLSAVIPPEMKIILVGKLKNKVRFPNNIIHIDYIKNIVDLAEIFGMSDVYLHTSTEDTFGKVLVEAMSTGTPVIAFNSTVYPEIVCDRCGYIVKKYNTNDIFEKIQIIQKKTKNHYSFHCIQHVKNNYNKKKNIKKIIELYKAIR